MRKSVKVFSIFFFFCFLIIMTLPFAFAVSITKVFESNLPQPEADDQHAYLVIGNNTNLSSTPQLFEFSCKSPYTIEVTVSVESSGHYWISAFLRDANGNVINDPNLGKFNVVRYNALNGSFGTYASVTYPTTFYNLQWPYSSYPSILTYGCTYSDNDQHPNMLQINWAEGPSGSFRNTLLDYSLTNIQSLLENIWIIDENIYNGLREYVEFIALDMYPFFIDEVYYIEDQLDNIISLLGGDYESNEIDQPSQSDDINELASAEAAIERDVGSDMQSAFSNYGQVFTGNGAFALIKSGFESFILGNSKINALIVFCLTLGIGTLIIGRRISA